MKREFLEKLGLEKDAIDKIMDENGKDVESAKTKATELEGELTKSKEMLAERDKQIDTLSKSKGNAEEMKAEIDKLKAANTAADEKHQSELKEIKMNNAITSTLSSAKAKNLKAAVALLDKEKLQLQDDGTVLGLAEQIKTLTEGEDTKFLFGEPETKVTGAKPAGAPGGTPATTAEQEMAAWREEAGLK